MFSRWLWTGVMVLVVAVGWAAEPGPGPGVGPPGAGDVGQKKEWAPDELPVSLIKILRTTNKAQTNRYVPKVYTVNNVNPYELYRWVRRTAQIEEGGYFLFGKPDKDGNINSGKIVLIVPEYMLPGIDDMMKVLDRPGLNSAAGDLWFMLDPDYRTMNDTGYVDMLRAIRGSSGDVVPDPEVNRCLIYAVPSKVEGYKITRPWIDVPPPQVMVEATIYEVAAENESKIGLDYVAWKNGPGRNLFAAGAFSERERITSLDSANPLLNTGVPGGTWGLPGHGFRASGNNFAWFLDVPAAFFDFLVVKGKARVMTSAKLCTRNLYTASLSAGDAILYYNTRVGPAPNAGIRPANLPLDPNDVPTTGTPPVKSNTYPDNRTVVSTQTARTYASKSGVTLTITPTMGEKEMNLDIVTAIVSHTGFDDKGAPVLATRSVDSKVVARDGQEIVLGGYTREVFVQRTDRVPVLGSLPFIGYLFGGDTNTTEQRQLVVVLTPHVVQDFKALEYKGTQIDAALIQSKALGKAAAPLPKTEAGFDQWLLDSGR